MVEISPALRYYPSGPYRPRGITPWISIGPRNANEKSRRRKRLHEAQLRNAESYVTSIFHVVRGYYARYICLRKLNYLLSVALLKRLTKKLINIRVLWLRPACSIFPFLDFFNLRIPRNIPCNICTQFYLEILFGERGYMENIASAKFD